MLQTEFATNFLSITFFGECNQQLVLLFMLWKLTSEN